MKVYAGILLAAALAGSAFGQGGSVPFVAPQYLTNGGLPNAGGQLCTYLSSTSTPAVTYSDAALSIPNSTCITLNSAGRPQSGGIFLGSTVYRFVLKDSAGVTIWTQDGVAVAAPLGSGPWTGSGTSIYNNVSGSKVCIASSGTCTTPLSLLDVQGSGSAGAHIVRIDDAASQPGIDLYSNGSWSGSYAGDASGLKLLDSNGVSQMTLSATAVTIQNTNAGATNFVIKAGSSQGTTNPIDILDNSGSNLAHVDPAGNGFFAGVAASGTQQNQIQAPNGGVTAKWVIGTDSLFLLEEPQPALSASGQARIYADNTSHTLLVSQNGGGYAPLGGGGGGGGSFSGITSGANTVATMTVGTGASITFTGSGSVNASAVNGTTVPTNSAADQVILTTASATGSWGSIPGCLDSGGNHLNYNTSTHAFTCGNTGGTVGSVSFSGITGSTNTSASMVVGSGASLTVSGTGTINATQINNGNPPVSGSIWKSNSLLQPTTANYSDVVALFSGGAGCSGTNVLAANGTCVASSGGGAGGIGGSIQYNNGSGGFTGNSVVTASAAGIISPVFNSTVAYGGGIGFQISNAGGTPFQVNGQGDVSAFEQFNVSGIGGSYKMRGNVVIDSNLTGNFSNLNASGNLVVSGNTTTTGLTNIGASIFTGDFILGNNRTMIVPNLSVTGSITPPIGTALNGSYICTGGQHINGFTVSFGLLTAYTCN